MAIGSRINRFFKNLTAAVSCFALLMQPVFAQSIVPGGSSRPDVLRTANGTPMVQVTTPDVRGVSHNTFTSFSVGPEGVVLNNAAQNYVLTGLAGYVQGNSAVAAGPAGLILIEVVAPNPSTLSGYFEIAGTRADLVFANPYGVTCDGCGFINTDRAVLSTGTPIWDTGGFTGLRVERGALEIGRGGADARGVSQFDLIARQVVFNGTVHGQRVRVIAGRNDVILATGEVRPQSGGTSTAGFAIDSTVFGGMYADKITIRSTEQGVGVRAPSTMSAGAGGMHITADGRLVMGTAVSQGPTTVRAPSVQVRERVHSRAPLSVAARQEIILDADAAIVSDARLDVVAGTDVTFGARSTLGSSGVLNLTAAGRVLLAENSAVLSWGDLNVRAGSADLRAGSTVYAGAPDADGQSQPARLLVDVAQDLSIQGARLIGRAALDLSASSILADTDRTLPASSFVAGTDLSISSGSVDASRTQFSSVRAMTFDVSGAVGFDGARLTSGAGLDLRADELTLVGTLLESTTDVTVAVAGQISGRQSNLVAGNSVVVTAGSVDLNGSQLIANNGLLQVTAARDLTLDGLFAARQGVTLSGGAGTTVAGGVQSHSAIAIRGATLRNSAALTATGNIGLSATGSLHNTGAIATGQLADLRAGSALYSNADLRAQGGVRLSSGAGMTLAGSLRSGGDIVASSSADLTSSAGVLAVGSVTFTAGQDVVNTGSGLLVGQASAQNVTLRGRGVTNAGDLIAAGRLDVTASGGAFENSGTLIAQTGLSVDATGAVNNAGTLRSLAGLTISGATYLGAAGSSVSSGSGLSITASGLVQNAGELSAAGGLDIIAGSYIGDPGSLAASGADLQIVARDGSLTQNGRVEALGTITLTAATDMQHSGYTAASGPGGIAITAASAVLGGELSASHDIRVQVGNALQVPGLLRSGDTVAMSAGSYQQSGTIFAERAVQIETSSGMLQIAGVVVSNGTVSLVSASTLDLSGTIQSQKDLILSADSVLASGVDLATVGLLSINSATDLNLSGALIGGQGITLTSGGNLESSASYLSSGTIRIRADGTVVNTGSGAAAAGQADAAKLMISGASLTNSGNWKIAGDVTLNALTGDLLNTGSIWSMGSVSLASSGGRAANTADILGASDLAISGVDTFNSGNLSSDGNITLSGASLENQGNILSLGMLRLTSTGTGLLSSGNLSAAQGIRVQSAQALQISGALKSSADIVLRSEGDLVSSASLLAASTVQLSAGAALINTGSGAASQGASAQQFLLSGASVTNSGDLLATDLVHLSARAGGLRNDGILGSGGAIRLDATAAVLQAGTLTSNGDVSVSGGSISNTGTISGLGQVTLISTVAGISQLGVVEARASAELKAATTLIHGATAATRVTGGNLVLTSGGNATLDGALAAFGQISAENVGDLSVPGQLYGGAGVSLVSGSQDISGSVKSAGDVIVKSLSGDVLVGGDIAAGALLSITSARDVQQLAGSTLTAVNADLEISGTQGRVSLAGLSQSNHDIRIDAQAVTVAGVLRSPKTVRIQALAGGIDMSGTTETSLLFLQSGAGIQLSGVINAGLRATATGRVQNAGVIDGSSVVVQAGGFTNTAAGQVVTQAALLELGSQGFENAGVFTAVQDIKITAADVVNSGRLDAGGVLQITALGQANFSAGRVEGGQVNIAAAGLHNTALILSEAELLMTVGGTLLNEGTIEAHGVARIASDVLTNRGAIRGFGSGLVLAADQALDNTGGEISAATALSIETGEALSYGSARWGTITTAGSLSLAGVNGGYLSQFDISAGQTLATTGDLVIRSTQIVNGGTLASTTGDLILIAQQGITNTGLLYSGGAWTVLRAAGDIENTGGAILAAGSLVACGVASDDCLAAQNTDWAGGFINSDGGVVETFAGSIILLADRVLNQRAVTIVDNGIIFNDNEGGPDHTSNSYNRAHWGLCYVDGSCAYGHDGSFAASGSVVDGFDALSDPYNWQFRHTITEVIAGEVGPATRIVSGSDLVITGGSVTNRYALISASGDITITAQSLHNLGRQTGQRISWGTTFIGTAFDYQKGLGLYGDVYSENATYADFDPNGGFLGRILDGATYNSSQLATPIALRLDTETSIITQNNQHLYFADMPGFVADPRDGVYGWLTGELRASSPGSGWAVFVPRPNQMFIRGDQAFGTIEAGGNIYASIAGTLVNGDQTEGATQLSVGPSSVPPLSAMSFVAAAQTAQTANAPGTATLGQLFAVPNRSFETPTGVSAAQAGVVVSHQTQLLGTPSAVGVSAADIGDPGAPVLPQAGSFGPVTASDVRLAPSSVQLVPGSAAVPIRSGADPPSTPAQSAPIAPVTASGLSLAPSSVQLVPGSAIHAIRGDVDLSAVAQDQLFTLNPGAVSGPLIETAHQFIDLSTFLSSDYFLKTLGHNPGEVQQRFGDALAETYLIRDQIFNLTGRRLLMPSVSEKDQIKALYDNALDAASALDLQVGVSLTPQQIAALTKDIIWLEERVVSGRRVLVPQVYLAGSKEAVFTAGGAQIRGSSVTLNVGSLSNAGQIVAANDLTIEASGDVTNAGGVVQAGGDLTIEAQGTIRNSSGQILGHDVALVADTVFSDIDITRIGSGDNFTDLSAGQSVISAMGKLDLVAVNDITIKGSSLSAGTGVTIQSLKGNVSLGAAHLEHRFASQTDGQAYENMTMRAVASSVTAGSGDISVSAAKDIRFSASDATAHHGTIALTAGGDVALLAERNMSYTDYLTTSGNWFKSTVSREERLDVVFDTTVLDAEKGVQIVAGRDIVAQGARLISDAGDIRTITTTGSQYFASTSDLHVTSTMSRSSYLGGLMEFSEHSKTLRSIAQGVRASAGGDIAIRSDKDLRIDGGQFVAGGDITTQVGGRTALLGTVDTSFEQVVSHRNNSLVVVDETNLTISQDAGFASFEAGGVVDFDEGSAVQIGLVGEQAALAGNIRSMLGTYDPENPEKGIALRQLLFPSAATGATDSVATGEGGARDPAWDLSRSRISVGVPGSVDGAAFAIYDELRKRESTQIGDLSLVSHRYHNQDVQLGVVGRLLVTYLSGQIVGALGNVAGVPMGAVQQAIAESIVSNSLEGMITGKLDLGAVLKDAAFTGISGWATDAINLKSLGVEGLSADSYLGMGQKFSEAKLAEGLLDTAITAGLSSAIYGTDFGDNFVRSYASHVVMAATADLQTGIGDWAEKHGGEGSVGHVLMHAGVGCLASELLRGKCGAGAAAAAASALYAGTLKGRTGDDVEKSAELIGGLAAALASGGDTRIAGIAAAIGKSAFENNYLIHAELEAYLAARAACGSDRACLEQNQRDYDKLLAARLADFINCVDSGDITCLNSHLQEIWRAQPLAHHISSNGLWGNGLPGGGPNVDLVNMSLPGLGNISMRDARKFADRHCGGVISQNCAAAIIAMTRQRQARFEEFITVSGMVVPPIGVIDSVTNCGFSPTLSNCADVALEALGPVGDAAGVVVSYGGKLFTATRRADGSTEIVAGASAPNTAGELFSQRPTSFDPMNPDQFTRIQEAFARQGKTFDSSEDALRYLETRGADGVTFNADTILVRPDASPSTIFEELIHSGQHRSGRYAQWSSQYGNAGATARAEYEAATRLVRNQRAYGISDAEHAVNQARVQEFGRQLDQMGVPRD